jgi:GTPase SAR1 family protein
VCCCVFALTELTRIQDEYSILQSKHFIGIHGYLLVYSVSSRASFDMINNIRDKILNTLGSEKVPMVIIGNKADLPSSQHAVTAAEGQALGKEMSVPWIEASARTSDNVNKAFELVIGEIEKLENGEEPKKDGCRIM